MSFSIERYKEESKKLGIAGIGRRLIDNEEWAVATPKKSPVGELTTRRSNGADSALAMAESR